MKNTIKFIFIIFTTLFLFISSFQNETITKNKNNQPQHFISIKINENNVAAKTKTKTSYKQSRQYWTKTVTFKKIKVYQAKNQFKYTKANIERMKKGRAPIGSDGKSVNLHHMTQRNTSSIAEVTSTFHKKYSKILHINPNTIPSGIDRKKFTTWKSSYWKWRATHK